MNPSLLGPATYMGQKSLNHLPLAGEDATQWRQNDGLVPAYAQLYPRIGEAHPVGIEFTKETPTAEFEPGRWHYQWEHGVDHLDICVLPQPNQRRRIGEFYTRLLERLAELPR